MPTLCRFCRQAHPHFKQGPCYLCNDQLANLPEKILQASELLEGRQSFCLSTQLPDDWVKREEELLDWHLEGAQTIKQMINQAIVAGLTQNGRKYFTEAPYRLQIDFFHGIVQVVNEPVFFFGRYQKHQANLSQTRWICSTCRGKGCGDCKSKGKFYDSVEEAIGEPFQKAMKAENYILHASGREDVDATNTAGRPFVLEIVNPEEAQHDLTALAGEIAAGGRVSVSDLKRVRRNWVQLVSDSHFDKEYEVEVEFSQPADERKLRELERRTPIRLQQQTPTRVAHRRADLVRPRQVLEFRVLGFDGNHARLSILAEAGTYIKEFVSGDAGRTKPSVSEWMGSSAVCKKLVVTRIYDGFLEMVG